MKRLIVILLGLLFSSFLFGQQSRLSTRISRSAGFHNRAIEVTITSTDKDADIFYTMDGSLPHENSLLYKNSPISIDRTTILRAFSMKGTIRSNVVSKTYIIEKPGDFPSVSIAIKPSYLFNPDYGLFMMGNDADSLRPHRGANFWSRKELIVHTELFGSDGKRVFSGNTGMRLFGGMSRLFPQKSLALVTRSRYGPTRIRYPLFKDKPMKKYKYMVLRNSGSDWGKANLRDVFVTSLIKDLDLEMQSFQPAKLYLNGKYWGIYNIREKINRYYLSANTGVHKDSVSIIEHKEHLKRGEKDSYQAMLKFMRENDLGDQENFDYVATQMDVRNFTDLQITQIYIDNQDAGGNIKFWKPFGENTKWRWIVYDTDWGFGLHKAEAFTHNSLKFHLEPNGPKWPNPPWSTFILRSLLENKDYKEYFVNRFLDHLNTHFEPTHLNEHLDKLVKLYQNEMPRHLNRWNINEKRYKTHLARIRNFGNKRPEYIRKYISQEFNCGKEVALSIKSSKGGRVVLNNNIELQQDEMKGTYFDKIPVHLKAIPQFGYKFSHWDGVNQNNTSSAINLKLEDESYTITAVFEVSVNPLEEKIIFNEVCPNNKLSGDWIELYNSSNEDVSLGGWYFLDTDGEFEIPSCTLKSGGYLVICQDTTMFKSQFPEATNLVGNIPFGLSKKKERLQLFTKDGAPIDSIYYELLPRDSSFTLSLLLPYLDNTDAENWELRKGVGSPKAPNPTYLESRAKKWRGQLILGLSIAALVLLYLLIMMIYRNRHHFK